GRGLWCAVAQPACQRERLVRPDPDRLTVATPVAGVADVRERAVTPEAEVDPGYRIAVRNGRALSRDRSEQCALLAGRLALALALAFRVALTLTLCGALARSEERRVGKGCRPERSR